METRQTTVHFGDAETAMPSFCGKRSNAERLTSNEDDITTKRKRNDAPVIANDTNFENEQIKLIVDDLPSEVLEAILCSLSTSDLVNCRQVNRKWNEITSRVMRKRADIQIAFSLQGGQLVQSIQNQPRHKLLKDFGPLVNEHSTLSFSDLVECLKQSQNFPFTNFRFKDVIRSDDMEHFLSIWGRNIYALGVEIDEVNDIEMLSVLLAKTPNLKKLYIHFGWNPSYYEPRMEPSLHLFVDSNEIRLSTLNVLRVSGSSEYFSGIVVDILKVASNLNCFEKHSLDENGTSECITARDLAMLQSLNKLHCLKDANLLFKEELITLLENSPPIMDLQLKSIELSITWIWEDYQLCSRATKIINKFFDSSKYSLQELKIPPLGQLSGLVIPVFENLRKMSMSHDESYDDYPGGPSMFPPLFEMADHFPNLRELTVAFLNEDNYFSTYQPLNVMPKVELLRVVYPTEYDETLMQLTPNVKTLLVATSDMPPTMNFKAISTHLKKLENLCWQIHAESQQDLQSNCALALDSIITGFPRKYCKKMYAQFRDKVHLPEQTVASYERYRRNFSILDLKELKRFDLSFTASRNSCGSLDFDKMCSCEESDCESCKLAGFYRDSYLYNKHLTKVSQFLAFDLMPDLNFNITSEYLR